MVWRDRFWVQQREERKKIDTLLHQPRGKETQPWLVIVFLLYFDGRTVNGLIRRLLSKNAICQREKKGKKFFWGVLAAPRKRKKKLAFPPGLHYSLGPRFLPFSPLPLCFLCVFLYSFFLFICGESWLQCGTKGDLKGVNFWAVPSWVSERRWRVTKFSRIKTQQ